MKEKDLFKLIGLNIRYYRLKKENDAGKSGICNWGRAE